MHSKRFVKEKDLPISLVMALGLWHQVRQRPPHKHQSKLRAQEIKTAIFEVRSGELPLEFARIQGLHSFWTLLSFVQSAARQPRNPLGGGIGQCLEGLRGLEAWWLYAAAAAAKKRCKKS